MKSILLYLNLLRWRWMLAEARTFRSRLENTIINERIRARIAVEHAEVMERRAEMAIITARADRLQETR